MDGDYASLFNHSPGTLFETPIMKRDETGNHNSKEEQLFDEAKQRVSAIFENKLSTLQEELRELSSFRLCHPLYVGCSGVCCLTGGLGGAIATSVFSVPPILPAVSGYLIFFGLALGIGGAGGVDKETKNKEKLENVIQKIQLQKQTILSEDCKKFCLSHKFTNLDDLLENNHFPEYMRTSFEIKNLEKNVETLLDNRDVSNLVDQGKRLRELKDRILLLEKDLEIVSFHEGE